MITKVQLKYLVYRESFDTIQWPNLILKSESIHKYEGMAQYIVEKQKP